MGHRYAEIAFTEAVRALQVEHDSRGSYARMEAGAASNDRLGEREAAFIAGRDSFYMATVSGTGWPYVQHRGGPVGFVAVLDERTIGFADFSGNKQYVSLGNLAVDERVSLFFMDYARRRRLKIFGRARAVAADQPQLLAPLAHSAYRAKVERGMLITVEAFDWNCPQHITPRFTGAEVESLIAPLRERIAELEAQLETATAP